MKKLSAIVYSVVLGMSVITPCEGTMPFPTLKAETSSGSYSIHINPQNQDAVSVYNAAGDTVATFTIDELGFTVWERLERIQDSTSGLKWYYPNAVTFFSSDERFFILHLAWGKSIVLDLEALEVLTEIPKDLNVFIVRTLRSKAMVLIQDPTVQLRELHPSSARRYLLDREMATERETGAMICGHLRIREAIPRLRELLQDDHSTIIGSGGGQNRATTWRRIYFVRKAAHEALTAMRQRVRNVLIEEVIDDPFRKE